MRALLVTPLLLALTACGSSTSTTTPGFPPQRAALAVGDTAPALVAEHWLNGPRIDGFERGKVYVLDFWATWCGPCIQMMPHLAELQHEYGDQGVVIVPVTTVTSINPLERIQDFVAKRGPKLGLTFAVAESKTTDQAYMEASGSESLPTTFVIDRAGRVAFIGHPMMLDDVLPKVCNGTWQGTEEIRSLERMLDAMSQAFADAEAKPEEGDRFIAEFEKKYPEKAKQPMVQASKVVVLLRAKKYDEAKALTEELIPKLIEKKGTSLLNNLRSAWGDRSVNPEQKHIELAVTAAEAVLKLEGEDDPIARLGLADAHFSAGDRDKAIEHGERAVGAAKDEKLKELIQKQIEKYRNPAK